MPFEFKPQHDYDLHIALEVSRPVLEAMFAKGKAAGIETRGISDHRFIDSIYFRDPNGYVIELCTKREDHDRMMDPAVNGAREKLQPLDGRQARGGRGLRHAARRRAAALAAMPALRRSTDLGLHRRGQDPATSCHPRAHEPA